LNAYRFVRLLRHRSKTGRSSAAQLQLGACSLRHRSRTWWIRPRCLRSLDLASVVGHHQECLCRSQWTVQQILLLQSWSLVLQEPSKEVERPCSRFRCLEDHQPCTSASEWPACTS
jgi:hypothetical protein